jgi:hypothetical protein
MHVPAERKHRLMGIGGAATAQATGHRAPVTYHGVSMGLYLRDIGRIPVLPPEAGSTAERELVSASGRFLRTERGLSVSTLANYLDDERIRTAIELVIASRYDTLPRSVFLSQLTAIDSLAIRSDRPVDICAWLDEKIKEARQLNDNGLVTSLEHLKQGSHGAAIRNLVGRAAHAMGESEPAVTSRQRLAIKLYGIRSGLSHAGGATLTGENVEKARQLARFVIDAAVRFPAILNG